MAEKRESLETFINSLDTSMLPNPPEASAPDDGSDATPFQRVDRAETSTQFIYDFKVNLAEFRMFIETDFYRPHVSVIYPSRVREFTPNELIGPVSEMFGAAFPEPHPRQTPQATLTYEEYEEEFDLKNAWEYDLYKRALIVAGRPFSENTLHSAVYSCRLETPTKFDGIARTANIPDLIYGFHRIAPDEVDEIVTMSHLKAVNMSAELAQILLTRNSDFMEEDIEEGTAVLRKNLRTLARKHPRQTIYS